MVHDNPHEKYTSQRYGAKQYAHTYSFPSLFFLPCTDCGSGIGRVTKRLLLPLFTAVDMVEQNETFLEKSKLYLGEPGGRVERRIAKGLQVSPLCCCRSMLGPAKPGFSFCLFSDGVCVCVCVCVSGICSREREV